ncbi:hypothetical protein [Leucobacter sp. NPDC077196]|uniref:hypothetical protein n=1 Tax=Leucobacter sp. NPDC077196 TaxID=3154959 RepID=UPI003436F971
MPRMDGTVSPKYVQQAFIDGYAGAVEQLPSRDEIAAAVNQALDGFPNGETFDDSRSYADQEAECAADAVLALIRECYEGES